MNNPMGNTVSERGASSMDGTKRMVGIRPLLIVSVLWCALDLIDLNFVHWFYLTPEMIIKATVSNVSLSFCCWLIYGQSVRPSETG